MKLKGQKLRIVECMRAAGPRGAHMQQLYAIALNLTARISDLRKLAFGIRAIHVQGSEFRYALDYEPPDEQEAPPPATATKETDPQTALFRNRAIMPELKREEPAF